MTLWSIVSIFHFYTVVAKDPLGLLQVAGISWPCKLSARSQAKLFLQTFAVLMSVLLPSGKFAATHKMSQYPNFLSPRPHPFLHLCVARACHGFTFLSLNLSPQVLHYLTRTMKKVYSAHTRKVCLLCSWRMSVMCTQLLSGTIANLSSREHCVAICTATDALRYLRVRTLYSIHDRASGK